MTKSKFTKGKIKFFSIFLFFLAIISICGSIGLYYYVGHYNKASKLNDYIDSKLSIGKQFTVDEILEHEKYKYGWTKSNIAIDVYAKDQSDEYKVTNDILHYNKENRTFTVCGIGDGYIQIKSSIDESINMEIPFATKFLSKDTSQILKDTNAALFYDDIISESEIKSIKELKILSSRIYQVDELNIFSNLERLVIQSQDIAHLQGLNKLSKDVSIYVNDNLYETYMSSEEWKAYVDRIYPTIDYNSLSKKHTVIFEFKEGIMPSEPNSTRKCINVEDGGKIEEFSKYKLERAGYNFVGWFTGYNDGATITENQINEDYVITSNLKLYPRWSAIYYKVIYHDTRFNCKTPDTQNVEYKDNEGLVISSMVLEYTGYTFSGWALEENSAIAQYKPNDVVKHLSATDKAEVHLYAVWSADSYTIVYDPNGGSISSIRHENVKYDQEVQLRSDTPLWTGHTFLGWSTNINSKYADYQPGDIVSKLTANSDGQVVLYAIWSANKYTIHYDANGGTNPPIDQENLIYGEMVTLSNTKPKYYGRVFNGWSTNKSANTAEYSAGSTVKNLTPDSNGSVVLYAVWSYDKFTIKYDANGGNNAPKTSGYIYYNNSTFTISNTTPTRAGHTFKGWSLLKDGSTQFTKGQQIDVKSFYDTYVVPSSSNTITLYAIWRRESYKVTIESGGNDGGKIEGITNGKEYLYGSQITIKITYSGGSSKKLYVDGKNVGSPSTYKVTIPDHDFVIRIESSCVAAGTLILLEDGTSKKIENLSGSEKVLSWDFYSGELITTRMALLNSHEKEVYSVLNLKFDSGDELKIIGSHGLMDLTLSEFVYLNLDNYEKYLNHEFVRIDINSPSKYVRTKLESCYITEELTVPYSLWAAKGLTCVTNNLLSVGPHGYAFGFGFFDIKNMKYTEDSINQAVKKYGLYSYDDWKEYSTYSQFVAFNGQYAKIAVGLGLITEEELIALIKRTVGK